MNDKTREVLDGIKDRLTAATPGPWKWGGTSVRKDLYGMHGRGILRCSALLHPDVANAVFIAAAPVDVARLTRAIEGVLRLHFAGSGHNPECHCGIPAGAGARCKECGDEWPCQTVAAIEDALNPKEGQ